MPPFTTFLFDLDGTLIDHFAAIHRSHAHTMKQLGLPPPSLAEVRAAVGGGLETAIERLVGKERLAAALPIYRAYWDETMLDDVKLLPGTRELLWTIHARGAKQAVFTNKLGSSSRFICEHLGIAAVLDGVFGAKDTQWLKPAREFSAYAIARLGGEPETTLLVGDSPYDVQSAKNGGYTCWAVTTGTHNAEELKTAGADAVFADLAAVHDALIESKSL
jgi:phosphoglycolate phosphatase